MGRFVDGCRLQISMRILAISGSLQAHSSNGALVDAAVAGSAADGRVEVERSISTAALPAFNPDLEADHRPAPQSVAEFRRQVAAADGVLIATPEYAHSLPGALKNALDWLVGSGDLHGKPVAIVAASPHADGAARARAALEQTLHAQGVRLVMSLTVTVPAMEFRQHGLGPGPRAAVAEVLDAMIAAAVEARRA